MPSCRIAEFPSDTGTGQLPPGCRPNSGLLHPLVRRLVDLTHPEFHRASTPCTTSPTAWRASPRTQPCARSSSHCECQCRTWAVTASVIVTGSHAAQLQIAQLARCTSGTRGERCPLPQVQDSRGKQLGPVRRMPAHTAHSRAPARCLLARARGSDAPDRSGIPARSGEDDGWPQLGRPTI